VDEEQLIAGRYRLARRIGGGGMGVVWQGYDERLHRKVAVKQLVMPVEMAGPGARRAVIREGRIAAKLQHPHVIGVYDVIEDRGQPLLIMEYVPSQSLAERGPLPLREVVRIGAEVADALAAAHAAGIVHRDVKPGNVLLAEDGSAKVTDFGISRAVEDATTTGTGMIAGTPAYLSPEVARGLPATYASDVFSLGATLYAAVEGTPPAGTADNPMALLYRVAHGDLRAPTRAGPLTDLLTGMLQVDPERRPTMTEVRDRLTTLTTRTAPPPELEPATQSPNPSRSSSRRRAIVLAVASLVVLLAVASGILLLRATAGDHRTGSAAPPATSSGPASTSGPSQATRPSGTPSPPATTGTAAPNSPAPPPVQTGGSQRTPAGTITDYYALMPANLPQAWTWLTPRYQQHPAGGYSGYQTFWSQIRTVRVSNVNPLSGNQVEATVDYTFKDGRVIHERHRYTLINQNGRWLIDQSTVLVSQTF
jgi:eukaryotic-like serine/threonine-protein kinase